MAGLNSPSCIEQWAIAPVARWRSHAQYSAPPCCNAPGRRKLAVARANCGILRRKSAWSWPVGLFWLCRAKGWPCASWYVRQRLRRASGRCGPAAPWYFLSPLPCPVGHYMNVTVCIWWYFFWRMEGKILDNRSVLTYYKHIGRGWSPTTKAAQRQEHENAFHNFSKKTFRYRKSRWYFWFWKWYRIYLCLWKMKWLRTVVYSAWILAKCRQHMIIINIYITNKNFHLSSWYGGIPPY